MLIAAKFILCVLRGCAVPCSVGRVGHAKPRRLFHATAAAVLHFKPSPPQTQLCARCWLLVRAAPGLPGDLGEYSTLAALDLLSHSPQTGSARAGHRLALKQPAAESWLDRPVAAAAAAAPACCCKAHGPTAAVPSTVPSRADSIIIRLDQWRPAAAARCQTLPPRRHRPRPPPALLCSYFCHDPPVQVQIALNLPSTAGRTPLSTIDASHCAGASEGATAWVVSHPETVPQPALRRSPTTISV